MSDRYRPMDFARVLEEHLKEWRCGVDGTRSKMWDRWTDGIYPSYRALAEEVVRADSVKLHKYAAHLRSSQAFAFNLFLPFREGNQPRLSKCVGDLVGVRLSIDKVCFEWVPPGALLGEIDGDRPRDEEAATAADITLCCRLEDGQRAAVLIEIKLSEGGFTQCRGRESAANHRKDVCASARLFYDDPRACYLRRPKRKRRDRRYWEIFTASHGSVRKAFPGADMDGPCPFAGNAQQPMRNFAIARGLEQEGTVARAYFVLCAHDDNLDVARHWAEWRGLLPDSDMAPSLPASEVVRSGEAQGYTDWAVWMRNRYRL